MSVPKNPFERRVWAKSRLELLGSSFSHIARQEGVLPSAISRTFSFPSSHLEQVVAAALGVTAQELFPERFDARGNRLGVIREKKRNTKTAAESCPKCRAA